MKELVTARPTLAVREITVHFGGLTALSDVSFEVHVGARHGVLGPNGAGKTTLFNVISGFVQPHSGSVEIRGKEVTRLPPHRRMELGLARTFQITTLFSELTALENVLMGALVTVGHHRNVWQSARQDKVARSVSQSLLDKLGLAHLSHTPVHEIGYGEQRQIEIAVALATDPQILLLDEPTAGLSAAETKAVSDFIRNLPDDLTVVLIEHDIQVVFNLADHLTVLHNGECIANGPAHMIQDDPVVKEVYLGGR